MVRHFSAISSICCLMCGSRRLGHVFALRAFARYSSAFDVRSAPVMLHNMTNVMGERPFRQIQASTGRRDDGLFCINCVISSDLRLIVKQHIQQRTVNFYLAIVTDEAKVPELVHKGEPPPIEQSRPGTQITVLMSFKRNGELFEQPRITFQSGEPSEAERASYRTAVAENSSAARAQQPAMPVIGFLKPTSPETSCATVCAHSARA